MSLSYNSVSEGKMSCGFFFLTDNIFSILSCLSPYTLYGSGL